jgi:amino acid transporter
MTPPGPSEDETLRAYGYDQRLDRSIGRFASFCIGFSVISATTAVYSGFGLGLLKAGPAFVWTFPIAVAVFLIWAVIAGDLASKIPLSGYAYQWTSRLVGPTLGWFTGYAGLIGFTSGFTGIAYTLAAYLSGLFGVSFTLYQQLAVTAGVILLCVLINVYGVRFATRLNNIGVSLEFTVTIGATALVAAIVAFSGDMQPLSYLVSTGDVTSSPFVWAWLASSLGCIFGLLGVEAAADVAEETKDARKIIPRTMFYALGASAVVEFVMYVVFLLCIKDPETVLASGAPIETIMSEQISPVFSKIVVAVALTNILVCVLANMLVATRLLYAMARDNMTPFADRLSAVSSRHKTPSAAVWTTGGISLVFLLTSLLSPTAFAYIIGMCTLGYFTVYILTTAGLMVADRRGTFPEPTPDTFDLGSRRRAVHRVGMLCFVIIALAMLLLPDYRANSIAFAVVMALGLFWWALRLRGRLALGDAGPAFAQRRIQREPVRD